MARPAVELSAAAAAEARRLLERGATLRDLAWHLRCRSLTRRRYDPSTLSRALERAGVRRAAAINPLVTHKGCVIDPGDGGSRFNPRRALAHEDAHGAAA